MALGTDACFDLDALMVELRLYLVAIEAFRAEGREPVAPRGARRVGAALGDGGSRAWFRLEAD